MKTICKLRVENGIGAGFGVTYENDRVWLIQIVFLCFAVDIAIKC